MREPEQNSIEPNAALDTMETIAPAHDEFVVEVLAAKILIDWLRNRQQLLIPFTLDLGKHAPAEVETLVHAMAAAALADGALDGKERERLEGALQSVNADDRQRAMLKELLEHPKPLAEVLREVRDVKTGALVYAASLLAIDRRKPVNRHYLRYLAARLQLPQPLARSLEQRFRLAG
ncbi:MAG: hypothetical protein QOK44_5660 [Betaproteobacteria bacterium]|nr:hypothetical protein [Betaproteobacteria bacterium]